MQLDKQTFQTFLRLDQLVKPNNWRVKELMAVNLIRSAGIIILLWTLQNVRVVDNTPVFSVYKPVAEKRQK